jgi:antirestriction protein ArdC
METTMPKHLSCAEAPSASHSLYEAVTATIVEALERGVVPWRRPWQSTPGPPVNAISKRPYRGVNVLILSLAPFAGNRWLTFKQANELGGSVRKGERSSLVVFWKTWKLLQSDPETGETTTKQIPLLRSYHVFNTEQCDGLSVLHPSATKPVPHFERIEQADELIRSMPEPPTIREGGTSAWYRPSDDLVQVPILNAFKSPDAFFATLLHELGHATGHSSRLGRPGIDSEVVFGSDDYSREELVAELTSAFCCAGLGLDNSLLEDSANYIGSWLKVLKADVKAIVIAAAQAQRASDFIHGVQFSEA